MKGKSISLEIREHEPAELKRLLEKFCAEVKNKHVLAIPTCEISLCMYLTCIV